MLSLTARRTAIITQAKVETKKTKQKLQKYKKHIRIIKRFVIDMTGCVYFGKECLGVRGWSE